MRNLFKKGISAVIALSMAASMAVMIPITASAEDATSGDWTTVNSETTETLGSGTWALEDSVLTVSGTGELPGSTAPWNNKTVKGEAQKIVIGDDITYIPTRTFFAFANVTELDLGKGLKTLDNDSFRSCTSLTTVELPASLENFVGRPFVYCQALESVTLAQGNTSYTLVDGVLFTADMQKLVYYPLSKQTPKTYTIPSSVKSIEGLYGQNYLEEVTIPSTVERIEDYGFAMMPNLKKLTIEEGVSYIGNNFPFHCDLLEELIIPESVTESGTILVSSMPALKTLKLSSNCSGALSIDKNTTSLESVDMGAAIPDNNFVNQLQSNKNLKEVKLSENITQNITLPESCTSVTVPANVVSKVTNLSSSKVENVTVTGTDSANTITSDIASAIPANATLTIGEGITSVDSAAATTLARNNTTVNVVDSDNSSSISETLSSANVKTTTVKQSSNAGVVRATEETGATAFKNTVSGTVGTVNKFTWAVTCNGVTKSFEFEKNSPNLTLGNGASADIALIVKGIASENATAYLTVE